MDALAQQLHASLAVSPPSSSGYEQRPNRTRHRSSNWNYGAVANGGLQAVGPVVQDPAVRQ